jgi:hypothetical protein
LIADGRAPIRKSDSFITVFIKEVNDHVRIVVLNSQKAVSETCVRRFGISHMIGSVGGAVPPERKR